MPPRAVYTRYVSPFGSPATMRREEAERYLAQDGSLYDDMEAAGCLDDRLLRIGRPRLDDTLFRLADLPEWVDGADFDVLRLLIARCERLTRERGEPYVVVTRDGARSAVLPQRLVIDGDETRWPLA